MTHSKPIPGAFRFWNTMHVYRAMGCGHDLASFTQNRGLARAESAPNPYFCVVNLRTLSGRLWQWFQNLHKCTDASNASGYRRLKGNEDLGDRLYRKIYKQKHRMQEI